MLFEVLSAPIARRTKKGIGTVQRMTAQAANVAHRASNVGQSIIKEVEKTVKSEELQPDTLTRVIPESMQEAHLLAETSMTLFSSNVQRNFQLHRNQSFRVRQRVQGGKDRLYHISESSLNENSDDDSSMVNYLIDSKKDAQIRGAKRVRQTNISQSGSSTVTLIW